jgi:histidinol-phosphate aminotransferase
MTSKIGLKHIHAIAPYVGGRPISEVARDYGLDESKIVKLASNENPLGMPQSAQDAMLKAAADLGRYPDSNGFELKKVLSERLGVPADWITLGNGSNDILELAARAVAQAGDEIIFSRHTEFNKIGARLKGGKYSYRLASKNPKSLSGSFLEINSKI